MKKVLGDWEQVWLQRNGGSVVGFWAGSVLLLVSFMSVFCPWYLEAAEIFRHEFLDIVKLGITSGKTSPGEYCDSCSLVGHAWTSCFLFFSWQILIFPFPPPLSSATFGKATLRERSEAIGKNPFHWRPSRNPRFLHCKGNRLNRLSYSILLPSIYIIDIKKHDMKHWHTVTLKNTSKWRKSLNQ